MTNQGSAGVFAFERVEVTPTSLVLDHSFVVAAFDQDAGSHTSASDFLARLIAAESTLFFNDLLELQLQETAFTLARTEVLRRRLASPGGADELNGPDRREAPDVSLLARSFLQRWRVVLSTADAVHVDLEHLLEDVPYFVERFGLTAFDSVQAAMTVASGADGIATTSPGFGAVDPSLLRIYAPAVAADRARALR